jgi:hypothetical protein
MKKSHIILAIIAVILIIAALTNPNTQRHKEAVKEKLTAYVDEKVKDDSSGLGALFGTALISRAVDSLVSSDNYLFFSLTKVSYQERSKVVGMGVFGNVILFGNVDDLASPGLQR